MKSWESTERYPPPRVPMSPRTQKGNEIMEINGTLTGELVKAQIKADKRDGSTMVLDMDAAFEQARAAEVFDADFVSACFAGMHQATQPHEDGDETVWRFDYSTKQPPRWAICQIHKANLWGVPLDVQPVIRRVTAEDTLPVVVVSIRFEVPVGDSPDLIGDLGRMVGQTVTVKLEAREPQFAAARSGDWVPDGQLQAV